MTDPEFDPIRISRRSLIKGGLAVMGGSLIGCEAITGEGSPSPESRFRVNPVSGRRRVAVVGGGAGGIAAAYFLDGVCDVDLFESRPKIGGHCDTRVVEYMGQKINVDLGAQFFHPDTHPIYVTILEELGLFNPDNGAADETLEAPGSITVFKKGAILPTFASNYPVLNPVFAIDFLIYSQYARAVILQNQSWEMTLEEWVRKLPVTSNFKNNLLYPWISALIGTNNADAKRSSARSILQTFALSFPSDIFKGASTFNSALGLEGNLGRMLDRSPSVQVHVDSTVQGLAYENGEWTVQTASGPIGPFTDIVMNAPPRLSKPMLEPLPWASDIVPVLDKYEYFDARMLIHTDPKYVHRDKHLWAAYNGMVDGIECEGSVWYGGIHQKLPSGATIDVFKSWAQRRASDPANIIYERRFKHPHITPQSIQAARKLRTFQGMNGLYFSGQYTTGFDLQEAAVYSAMKVADALAPTSSNLQALKARLQTRGRDKVNYDL